MRGMFSRLLRVFCYERAVWTARCCSAGVVQGKRAEKNRKGGEKDEEREREREREGY